VTAFGLLTLQNRPWEDLVAEWRWIEDLGFDSAWTADHFVSPLAATDDWFEGWTLLAALATHTSRVRLGTLVSSMTLRNPAVLARQALTVDHISGGRLSLGVGAGQVPDDHRMTGVERWPGPERADRFHEFVAIVRDLLHQRETTRVGTHYRVEGALMAPPPVSRPAPPIVVGALGPRMLRVAAELADVWNTIGGRGVSAEEAVHQTRQRVARFGEACEAFGRDPSSVRRSLLAFSFYVPDRVWDSVDAFEHFVGTYVELGFDEIVFDLPEPGDRHLVERVVTGSALFAEGHG